MEKFDFAIQVLVIGFSVVMVALIALYLLLLLFAKIFHKECGKPAEAIPAAANRAVALKPGEDRRLTAAITAAVYAYMQTNNLLPPSGRISITLQQPGQSAVNNWHVSGRRVLLQNKLNLENIRRKKQRENI
jgi:Na+-transporting methylmalonyl-CoA/oxaloacetate decarboxylase gamma subunit